MANDNVQANSGTGGATFRTLSDGTIEWPATVLSWVSGGVPNAWTFTVLQDVDGSRLPVKPIGPTGSFTNASTAIATGGSDQVLLTAATRRILLVWNPIQETEPLYLNFGSAAAADQTSFVLEPGAMLKMASPEFVSDQAVHVLAATTGHTIGCKWA